MEERRVEEGAIAFLKGKLHVVFLIVVRKLRKFIGEVACAKQNTRTLVSQRFVCMSRACLGKMVVSSTKMAAKKRRFAHRLASYGSAEGM